MTQILTNRCRRMLVFVLPHEEYCSSRSGCACTKTQRPERGVPSALTLPALATIEAPNAVLSVREIQSAIRRGDVTATHKPNPQPAARESAPDAGNTAAAATESDAPQRHPKKRARE